MKYRENMTMLEKQMLLRELKFVDDALRQMDSWSVLRRSLEQLEADIDAEAELRKAALNHRGQP